jgi:signal transduction histidine kinase
MAPTPALEFADLSHYQWLSVPAWVFDVDLLRIVWANDAALAYWRADSADELLARNFDDASPAMRARLRAARALHGEGRTTREVWTLYPRGTPITSTLIGRGLLLADGRLAILFASEPLAASYDAAVLRGIEAMQHTTVRVMLHRLDDGGALMRNPAATVAFGPLDSATSKADLAAMFVEAPLAERIVVQARRGQTFSGEAELVTLQGHRWHALDARPVRDPVTGDTVVQMNARDISDLKAYQQALEQARDAAEAASRAKSTFLANMSHEIRTPMNGVLGLTELVLATNLDERQRKFLELAHSSATSLMSIINDILDLSKIEAQRLTLESAPFSLDQLLRDALEAHRPEAESKGLVLDWRVQPGTPDALLGDAVRLRQILANLVGNALKFTPAGGVEVTVGTGSPVRAGPGGVELTLTVRDTGIGMTAQELARAFEPFTQADASITRRYGGTGLGLSIVQRLAQMMDGEVRGRSMPGQGSVFEVTLRLEACSVRE